MNTIDLINEIHKLCYDPVMMDFIDDPYSIPNHLYYIYLNKPPFSYGPFYHGRTRIYSKNTVEQLIQKTHELHDGFEQEKQKIDVEQARLNALGMITPPGAALDKIEADLAAINAEMQTALQKWGGNHGPASSLHLQRGQCKDPMLEGNVAKLSLHQQNDRDGAVIVQAVQWKLAAQYRNVVLMLALNALAANPADFFRPNPKEKNLKGKETLQHVERAKELITFIKNQIMGGNAFVIMGNRLLETFLNNPNAMDLTKEQIEFINKDLIGPNKMEVMMQQKMVEGLTFDDLEKEFQAYYDHCFKKPAPAPKVALDEQKQRQELNEILRNAKVPAAEKKVPKEEAAINRHRVFNLMANLFNHDFEFEIDDEKEDAVEAEWQLHQIEMAAHLAKQRDIVPAAFDLQEVIKGLQKVMQGNLPIQPFMHAVQVPVPIQVAIPGKPAKPAKPGAPVPVVVAAPVPAPAPAAPAPAPVLNDYQLRRQELLRQKDAAKAAGNGAEFRRLIGELNRLG